jgi:hypothetical protein
MSKRVQPRKAGDFKHPIGYDEWRWLTLWQPLLIGAGAGLGGLLVGVAVGLLGR